MAKVDIFLKTVLLRHRLHKYNLPAFLGRLVASLLEAQVASVFLQAKWPPAQSLALSDVFALVGSLLPL